MAIETLDDWNAILGQCCCTMPACPIPTQECESMTLDLDICGTTGSGHFSQAAPDGAASTYYLNKTYARTVDHSAGSEHYEQEDITTYFYEADYDVEMAFSGSCNSDFSPTSSGSAFCPFVGSGGTTTYTITGSAANGYSIEKNYSLGAVDGDPGHSYTDVEVYTYSDAISDQLAYLVGNAESRFAFLGFISNGSECASALEITTVDADSEATSINWVFTRFRWVIPDTWLDQNTGAPVTFPGTYFKITWDVATYPANPAEEISYIQDLTWEWTGPGDPEVADSWKSGWYDLEVPGEPGERKVVNVRFECYHSPQFGNKPQITGDAEDITNDVPLQYRFTSDNHTINLLRL